MRDEILYRDLDRDHCDRLETVQHTFHDVHRMKQENEWFVDLLLIASAFHGVTEAENQALITWLSW